MAHPTNFLHIPKTGGTALREALKAPIAAGTIVCHEHGTRFCDIPADEEVFFFLRDPLARFVSGFNSRLRQGKPRYQRAPWTAEQALLFKAFASANELAEGLSSDSGSTVAHALSAFTSIQLIAPLSFWFSSIEEVIARRRHLLFIGLQSEMDRDMENLSLLLGLNETIVLPCDDIGAHRSPADASTHLSGLAVKNLEAFYAWDLGFYRHMCAFRSTLNRIGR